LAAALHIAYYADDFTGATDALESLTLAGLRTRLFLDPPTPRQLAAHPNLQAIGVAGLTRSQSAPALARTLRPALAALRRLGPRHVHYKVCSTFDSSPRTGSIGRAIEVGRGVFGRRVVPLLVAAPALGRYSVFGNLFARYGIGSEGAIHRLDRHPAASRHPVTPMAEADLRRHLARQTGLHAALFDILDVALPPGEARARLRELVRGGADIVLFDALRSEQLARIGELIDGLAPARGPLFSVGSSGLGSALASAAPAGAAHPAFRRGAPPLATPLLVLSGSCSPVTGGQIEHALARGFTGIEIGPGPSGPGHGFRIQGSARGPARKGRDEVAAKIIAALASGRSVVAYTARGSARGKPADPRVLGGHLGRLGRAVLAATGLQRLLVAGGDTSSYAARALGIESVEMLARLAPGAPLCRAHAPGSPADGREVNFKGGQVGAPDYFVKASAR